MPLPPRRVKSRWAVVAVAVAAASGAPLETAAAAGARRQMQRRGRRRRPRRQCWPGGVLEMRCVAAAPRQGASPPPC